MTLLLKVLSFKNQPITAINAVSIDTNGGSIGRSDDNTLVLPDTEKFVSRHHASISLENGYYYLSDTSLGGITINGRETPLHNATERIDNGDVLKIGEYEIAVVIEGKPATDDFPWMPDPIMPEPKAFLTIDEPWQQLENVNVNSLMADNFPWHEELVPPTTDASSANFESRLQGNHSPLFDSYIAPDITPPPSAPLVEEIPENVSFDDFFSTDDSVATTPEQSVPTGNQPTPPSDFDDFFAAAISDRHAETDQPALLTGETPTKSTDEIYPTVALPTSQSTRIEAQQNPPTDDPAIALVSSAASVHDLEISPSSGCFADSASSVTAPIHSSARGSTAISLNSKLFAERSTPEWHEESNPLFTTESPVFANNPAPVAVVSEANKIDPESMGNFTGGHASNNIGVTDSTLFNAFLQGAAIESKALAPEQQTETLHRIGQMFRKLIDGTVAVLRSRAEFKSLCRVNITIIRSVDNNPLKFTVSTDDILRRLLENKTEGFLGATAAIDEAFNDIMNHQLAMQAGIQASLTDLLTRFDPKIIEKHFEQGIVLQKKAKCWDRYEQTYHATVEDAVENFFGDEFVRAYDQQMSVLKKSRVKRQHE